MKGLGFFKTALMVGAMAAAGFGVAQPIVRPPDPPNAGRVLRQMQRRRLNAALAAAGLGRYPRPSLAQRHTGAGGAGMHRAWKKRRASGRA